MERGFNDRAFGRGIVVHGSEYVGPDFLQMNKFCGRSYGCPAVPADESENIIDLIKEGSCLFIYYPTQNYLVRSKILNTSMDAHFRWFEGEKAQFRFVPYDWAFLFVLATIH